MQLRGRKIATMPYRLRLFVCVHACARCHLTSCRVLSRGLVSFVSWSCLFCLVVLSRGRVLSSPAPPRSPQVKFSMQFRGREIAHTDVGKKVRPKYRI